MNFCTSGQLFENANYGREMFVNNFSTFSCFKALENSIFLQFLASFLYIPQLN